MKRTVSILLVFVMLLLPASALAENWYLERAVGLTERIGVLAGDRVYIEMYMSTPEDILKTIEDAQDQSFSDPARARMLVMPSEKMAANVLEWLGAAAGTEFDRMSTAGKQELIKKLPSLFATLINGSQSAAWLSATVMLTTSETYIMPEAFEPCVLFLDYDDGYSAAVSFSKTGANTVTVSASLIPSGAIDGFTEDMPFAARVIFNGMFREIEVG